MNRYVRLGVELKRLVGQVSERKSASRAWPAALDASNDDWSSRCNICGWHGPTFLSAYHSEGATCPVCSSIARDRFLHWCWTERAPTSPGSWVLETSPRLDIRYKDAMSARYRYLSSDFDQSGHKAMIKLDLQAIDLPTDSIDVMLTSHVLEHVPDTRQALAEIFRIVRPGGHVLLQIPMPQGRTGRALKVEYHVDQTLVFWRFGWDLKELLVSAGFAVECLVTERLKDRVARQDLEHCYLGDDCDEFDLLSNASADDLTVVAPEREAHSYGFLPDFQFITWHAAKPPTR